MHRCLETYKQEIYIEETKTKVYNRVDWLGDLMSFFFKCFCSPFSY